ncbi:RNA polymerase sporulation-specific sigma factor [Geosporobacter subterraneus DSM 17957]|uniref:RNA polymerase sporulation-specific sigma factor n=1 Tax=Geosporobacter subterraneus DSM 17957 TaxID=1121919 RepID=A0A1M6CKK0_9FIRM|nr:sigma-70 family RNA polymerase sigma factor [Geosporobacter subterraneus]SHI61499.1 RNA polymerase sporulation-specific sigma factor [Geosporobacter subterraneus DSM 17957]
MEYDIQSLVTKAQRGEREAVAELIERLKPLIYASARRYYFGEGDKEDLLQEGYLKLLELLDKFDMSRGIPFLGFIKVHLKYFYMEKGKDSKKEAAFYILESLTEDGRTFIEGMPDADMSIEEKLVQREVQRSLGEAIQKLSVHQKRVISLCYGQGMDMGQIAKYLGVHYQTVVKTKERGLRRLRETMTEVQRSRG